jgi:hypothetical protein
LDTLFVLNSDRPNVTNRGKHWRAICAGIIFLLVLLCVVVCLLPFDYSTSTQVLDRSVRLSAPSKLGVPIGRPVNSSANDVTALSGSQIARSKSDENANEKSDTPEICRLGKEDAQAMMSSKGLGLTGTSSQIVAALTTKLILSERVRDKALGLFMYADQVGSAAWDAERLNRPGCDVAEPDCREKPFDASQRARATATEPLVKLALSSGNVDAYAIALYACRSIKTSVCGGVTYERWAEMEPNNAVVWLSLASQAQVRGDTQAQMLALQRAGTATDFNTRAPAFDAATVGSLLPAGDPLDAWAVGDMLIRMSLFNGDRYSGVGRYCARIGKDPDVNRPICDVLAAKLEQNDQSLAGGAIAAAIGEKLGWSAERVQLLKDERTVARGYDRETNMGKDSLTCAALEERRKWVAKSLLTGERAMARDVVSKSGKSLAEVAADYRKKMPDYIK